MLNWSILAIAIVAEVTATTALKYSEGFSRLLPSVLVIAGYVTSFWLLSQLVDRGMHLAVVYAIWSGVGISLIAIIGAVWLDEVLSAVQVGGLALVFAGILALQLGKVAA